MKKDHKLVKRLIERAHKYELHNYGRVYFLIREDKVIYVGQTIKLAHRIEDHCRAFVFDQAFYFEVKVEDLGKVEKAFIHHFRPEGEFLNFGSNNRRGSKNCRLVFWHARFGCTVRTCKSG